MGLQLGEPAVRCIRRHQGANRPLINGTSVGVSLEERRGDERLQHKPTADVDTTDGMCRDSSENTMKKGG